MKLSVSIPDEQAEALQLRYPDLGWSARIQACIEPMTIAERIAIKEKELEELRKQL